MNLSREALLMAVPLPRLVHDKLAERFEVIKLWQAENRDRVVRDCATRVRVIATAVPILAEGISFPIDAAIIAGLPELRLIGNLGVGYDNIDVTAAAQRFVIVTNTPDVLTEETADTALGLLLCAVRRLPQADRHLREGRWRTATFPLTASLQGRRLGIVGLGRIGKAIARRAESFGLEIAYHARREQRDVPYPFYASLEALACACDILMVATPGGAETRNLIDERILRVLGPDGVLINIARGTVVDEQALVQALSEGWIYAAGLDVFADEPNVPAELVAMDNVVLLPHVGSATHRTRDAMAQLLIENILSFADGRGPLTPVAETPWPWPGKQAQ